MKIGSLLLATTLALAVPAVMTGAYAASPELPKNPKVEKKIVKLEEKKISKDEKKLKADEKILKKEKTVTKGKPAAQWNQLKNKVP